MTYNMDFLFVAMILLVLVLCGIITARDGRTT